MDAKEREELTEKSKALRVELKQYERSFSAANEGRKPSNEDIKNNPEIAAKYKEYSKGQDILSGKTKIVLGSMNQTPRKRKYEDGPHRASKRQQITKTPTKTPSRTPLKALKPWEVDPYESPSVVRSLFTPRKIVLGPTPQKDGLVLGLFDLLEEDGTISTPSKLDKIMEEKSKAPIQATPRKLRFDEPNLQQSRTPGTKGRRSMKDAFSTPLKNRDSNGQGPKTPSSVSKLHFSTPSFLRRDNQRIRLPPVNEGDENEALSPQPVRLPRKPLVRGLSSILASLRKMQDEADDADLDVLHEMEMEEAGIKPTTKPKPKPLSKPQIEVPKEVEEAKEAEAAILVEDSQPNHLLGAFDDEAQFDSEPEEMPPLGRDGQPLKTYKKKGQKRTTRRSKLKPTRSHPAPPPKPSNEDEDEDQEELAAVPEIEEETMENFEAARNFDSDSQSEYTASEGGTRYRRPDQSKKNRGANRDGRIKTAARKVKASAHQNFKRLKLRNSGAKGGPGIGSRFRRRK